MLKSPPQILAGLSDQVTTGGASAAVALPVRSDGTNPKYVMVVADSDCYIDFGPSGVTAAAGTSIMLPQYAPLLFNVAGMTHFAHLQKAAGAKLTVSPLENQ